MSRRRTAADRHLRVSRPLEGRAVRGVRLKDGLRAQRSCLWGVLLVMFMVTWVCSTGFSLYHDPPVTVTTGVRQDFGDFCGNAVNVYLLWVHLHPSLLPYTGSTVTSHGNATELYSFQVGGGYENIILEPGSRATRDGVTLTGDSCQLVAEPFLDALRAQRAAVASAPEIETAQLLFP